MWISRLLCPLVFAACLYPATVEDVTFPSADGRLVHAAERVPDGDGPFPALLLIHGGGGGMEPKQIRSLADPESYSQTVREFAKRDWVLLSADFRPNAVFGKEEDDIVAAFRYLQTHPKVNRALVCSWGGSHGGHLSLRLAERVGEDLTCVAAGSPWLTDPVTHFFGDLDAPPFEGGSEESKEIIRTNRLQMERNLQRLGMPAEQHMAQMRARSIIENAGRIECPVLLVTSKGDAVVPHSTVEPFIRRLGLEGKDVEVFTAEDARHEYYLNANRFDDIKAHAEARERIVRFFEIHLQADRD